MDPETRHAVRTSLVNALESVVRATYGWITDDTKALGRITYFWHVYLLFFVMTLVLISHVVYPVLWFQIAIFCLCAAVWVQHMLLHFCVCTSLEIRLTGPDAPIAIDGLLSLFSIPISRETRIGCTLLVTTLMTGFLGLELIARGVLALRHFFGLSAFA